jgi:hypothetical protein
MPPTLCGKAVPLAMTTLRSRADQLEATLPSTVMSSGYKYLGNFAACEPWAAQGMQCHDLAQMIMDAAADTGFIRVAKSGVRTATGIDGARGLSAAPGRPPGSVNKITRTMKDAITAAVIWG